MNCRDACRISDSHNHIHLKHYSADREEVLERARAVGVESMLLVGTDPVDSRRAVEFAGMNEGIYSAVGIHPQQAAEFGPEDVFNLKDIADKKTIAIGETGFDLYYTAESVDQQRSLFAAHIELARDMKLPLIIHDRDAHKETVMLLDELDGWSCGGVMHCFSGDVDMARYCVECGFYISITGVVTFKNGGMLRDVVREIPAERLLVETDAPYLTPVPNRGKRNEPAYLLNTLERMADIKGCELAEMANITSDNFQKLFNLK